MGNIKKLQQEINFLRHDVAYDIDKEHHKERMRILKQKRAELKTMVKN